jgi:hypothetical protein
LLLALILGIFGMIGFFLAIPPPPPPPSPVGVISSIQASISALEQSVANNKGELQADLDALPQAAGHHAAGHDGTHGQLVAALESLRDRTLSVETLYQQLAGDVETLARGGGGKPGPSPSPAPESTRARIKSFLDSHEKLSDDEQYQKTTIASIYRDRPSRDAQRPWAGQDDSEYAAGNEETLAAMLASNDITETLRGKLAGWWQVTSNSFKAVTYAEFFGPTSDFRVRFYDGARNFSYDSVLDAAGPFVGFEWPPRGPASFPAMAASNSAVYFPTLSLRQLVFSDHDIIGGRPHFVVELYFTGTTPPAGLITAANAGSIPLDFNSPADIFSFAVTLMREKTIIATGSMPSERYIGDAAVRSGAHSLLASLAHSFAMPSVLQPRQRHCHRWRHPHRVRQRAATARRGRRGRCGLHWRVARPQNDHSHARLPPHFRGIAGYRVGVHGRLQHAEWPARCARQLGPADAAEGAVLPRVQRRVVCSARC